MAGGRLRAFGNRAGIAPLRNRDLRMPGKRVQIDNESWAALDLLAHDRMMTFQELADEAFADLLKKHGRPVDLRVRAGPVALLVVQREMLHRRDDVAFLDSADLCARERSG